MKGRACRWGAASLALLVGAACSDRTPQSVLPSAPSVRRAASPYADYPGFGYDLARTGYNPNETHLTKKNVSKLHVVWSDDLGAAIDAQAVVATGVRAGGKSRTIAYLGTEGGSFFALDVDDGSVVWSKTFPIVYSRCEDLPDGKFGITGTATIDRARNRVYFATASGNVEARDLATGARVKGWPLRIADTSKRDHVYGALTFNPTNGMLYAETAAFCDMPTWRGRIAAIDTSQARVASTFYPGGNHDGGGVWGMGGVSVDASGDVYATTGNSERGKEDSAYGEQIVRLDATLHVKAANAPTLTGDDRDFGATPMLYAPPGCAQQAVAKNKTGLLLSWKTASIAKGAFQSIAMARDTDVGEFIGVTAYSPVQNLVYVGVPDAVAPYRSGLVALAPQADCTLAPAWQVPIGRSTDVNDNEPPVIANGVVYFAAGIANELYAFDASTGRKLWNSGSTIGGFVFTPPTVDGRVLIGSWDHRFYAFDV